MEWLFAFGVLVLFVWKTKTMLKITGVLVGIIAAMALTAGIVWGVKVYYDNAPQRAVDSIEVGVYRDTTGTKLFCKDPDKPYLIVVRNNGSGTIKGIFITVSAYIPGHSIDYAHNNRNRWATYWITPPGEYHRYCYSGPPLTRSFNGEEDTLEYKATIYRVEFVIRGTEYTWTEEAGLSKK